MRQKLEENPRLMAKANMKETPVLMRPGKVTAELGASMVPEGLREQMERELAPLLEGEVSRAFEKM